MTSSVAGGVALVLANWCAAEEYYVSAQGSDSTQGTSTSSAFKTLEKAFGVLKSGDTLKLQKGDIWKPSRFLPIRASNIEIGAYGDGNRPVIDGQRKVPKLRSYTGLIHVTGDNVEIKDIVLENSGGSGIKFSRVDGALVDNVKVDWTYRFSIQAQASRNVVFKNCESIQSAAQFIDPKRPKGGWPHALSILATTDAVVEGCLVRNGWGEGIDAYRGSKRVVIRDNFVFGMRAVGIYVDGASNVDILRNTVLGTSDKAFHRNRSGYVGPGISINTETENVGLSPPRNINIYNNLVANTGVGIMFGGKNVDFKNIKLAHNTFIDNKFQFSASVQNFSGSGNIMANNVFLSIDSASSDVGGKLRRSSVKWHNNYWSNAPHQAMRSSGDVYGGAKVAKMSGWKNIRSVSSISADDFKPQAGSSTIDAARRVSGINVDEDHHGKPHGNVAELGAINFSSSSSSSPPPSSETQFVKPNAPILLSAD